MKWLYRNLYRKEKGFTLVELMIVIIILAILTGIAIPSYMALRNRARVAAAQSEMKNIATAIEMYNADTDAYPPTTYAAMSAALVAGDYMNPVPATDPWDIAYTYVLAAGTYTLTCTGANPDIVIINGQLQ
jgi:type II secretion system protein G